jgi:hypothetical protein
VKNDFTALVQVLSEAYSHLGFEERTRVSRALVLETVATAVAHRDTIVALTRAADEAGCPGPPGAFKRPSKAFSLVKYLCAVLLYRCDDCMPNRASRWLGPPRSDARRPDPLRHGRRPA